MDALAGAPDLQYRLGLHESVAGLVAPSKVVGIALNTMLSSLGNRLSAGAAPTFVYQVLFPFARTQAAAYARAPRTASFLWPNDFRSPA